MLKPKKSLGQNFLVDNNILKKISNLKDINNSNIVEIGPGTGNLTKEILRLNPKSLILIEKDKNLYSRLSENYKQNKKIQILNKDILELNIEKLIKKDTIIIGNLPYNISTKIFINLIKFNNWPPKYNFLILMFQKEVAEKIISNFNDKNYGRLRIISNYRLNVLENFNISRNCFFPKPKVDSTVIVFKPKTNFKYRIIDIQNLEKITNTFFSTKRKMINKAVKKVFGAYRIDKDLAIKLTERPTELSEEKYFHMAEIYEKKIL